MEPVFAILVDKMNFIMTYGIYRSVNKPITNDILPDKAGHVCHVEYNIYYIKSAICPL